MKNFKNLLVLFFISMVSFSSFATNNSSELQPKEEMRAVNINFFGGFTGFDPNSYKILKTALANLLAEGIIDHYITTGWGFEGGTSICVELTKDPVITINKVTDILQVIKLAKYL